MKTPPFNAYHVKPTHGSNGAFVATPVVVEKIHSNGMAEVRAEIGWAFYRDAAVDMADLATTPRQAGELLSKKLAAVAAEKSAAFPVAGAATASTSP